MIAIDTERCIGCAACVDACPAGALQLENGVARVNEDRCRQGEKARAGEGMRPCVTACPEEAIHPVIVIDVETRPVPVAAPGMAVTPVPRSAPWLGAALTFVAREVAPRVARSLLELWDDRRQARSLQRQAPAQLQTAGPSPADEELDRPLQRRRRYRGHRS